jgi:hypothetical protein
VRCAVPAQCQVARDAHADDDDADEADRDVELLDSAYVGRRIESVACLIDTD